MNLLYFLIKHCDLSSVLSIPAACGEWAMPRSLMYSAISFVSFKEEKKCSLVSVTPGILV